MFAPKKSFVDDEIMRIVRKMRELETDTEEYAKLLERLNKLHKIRQESKPDRISMDTLAAAFVNLAGILMILQYEHMHPITSKALSFIRLR